jgi:quinoprotein glucose dehydrogenase
LGLGRVGLAASPVPVSAFYHDAAADLKMPWLRQGLVVGLAGTQRPEDLLKLAQGLDAAQATFATLALARQRSPLLAQLLASPHQDVVNEAVRAIHDDEGIPAAQPALAQSLSQGSFPSTALRRVINQNLREGSPEAAKRILMWLQASPESAPHVEEALQALLVFELPPVLDLVDGTAKRYTKRDRNALAAVLRSGQAKLLSFGNESLKAKSVEILVRYGLDVPIADLLKLAKDTKVGASVRLQVLRLLSAKTESPVEIKDALLAATNDGSETTLRIEGMQLLAKVDPASALSVARRFLEVTGSNLAEKQAAVRVLFASTEATASPARLALTNKLLQAKFNESLRLDVYLAAQASTEPAIQAALKRYLELPRKPEQLAAPGLPYELLIAGGEPLRGRALAQEHLAANCVACHRFESDEGSAVGPALTKVGEQRKPAELAESLVNPSAKVVPGFGFETLTLRSGAVLAGSVVSETSQTLRLRQADGSLQDLDPKAVVSRTQPISIMPPMLGILSAAEVRDVVAYLASLKTKAPKAKK